MTDGFDAGMDRLPPEVLEAIGERLPEVAAATIEAVTREVPSYATLGPLEQATLARAVELALGGFLMLAASGADADPSVPLRAAIEGAEALGRGEARRGRSMDALLAAYRVGARIAWRGLAQPAADAGLDAASLVRLAELVFAYIDQLSAGSVAGHADELEAADRVRHRRLEALAHGLLTGAPAEVIVREAEAVDWRAPESMAAVLVDRSRARSLRGRLDPRTLLPDLDVPGVPEEQAVLLVPDARRRDGSVAAMLTQAVAGVAAEGPILIGPSRPWLRVRESLDRAVRAWLLVAAGVEAPTMSPSAPRPEAGGAETGQGATSGGGSAAPRFLIDADLLLPELVATADPAALADLRARALEPLAGLRPANAERLAATLRSWLLHQGRREAVAADLFVHPQTVRYRMGQVRDLFGKRLEDPRSVLELTIALAVLVPATRSDED